MTARCQDREHHHLHGRSANADGETGPGAKLAATGLLCSMPAGADNVTALLPMGTAQGRSRRPCRRIRSTSHNKIYHCGGIAMGRGARDGKCLGMDLSTLMQVHGSMGSGVMPRMASRNTHLVSPAGDTR